MKNMVSPIGDLMGNLNAYSDQEDINLFTDMSLS